MSSSAGRVLQIFKGDYSGSVQYDPLDCVLYQGSTYVCKATTQGNAPTNTTYWQLQAQGATNAAGLSYNNATSGLTATDVQAAIDEEAAKMNKTSVSKTGSGTTVTNTIAANTTLDNAVETLLNNDNALNTALKVHHKTTITNQTYKNAFDSLYSVLTGLDAEHYGSSEIVYYDGTARRHFYFNYVSTGQFVFSNCLGGLNNIQIFEIQVKNGDSTFFQTVVTANSVTQNDFSSTTFTGYVDLIY